MTSMFPIGTKVQTHSLTATDYNGLVGKVTGSAVEKNGVTRVPVEFKMSNGSRKSMSLKVKNLNTVKPQASPLNPRLQLEFYYAAVRGDLKSVKKCIKLGASIHTPDGDGNTAICLK
jgi:hypothetical protein